MVIVQFPFNKFFSWISLIFVGCFKSSRFFVSPCMISTFSLPSPTLNRLFNSDESGSKFGNVSAISRKRRRDRLHLEGQGTGNTTKPSWTWWWWWWWSAIQPVKTSSSHCFVLYYHLSNQILLLPSCNFSYSPNIFDPQFHTGTPVTILPIMDRPPFYLHNPSFPSKSTNCHNPIG